MPPAAGMGAEPGIFDAQNAPVVVPGPAKAEFHATALQGLESAQDSRMGFVKFLKGATKSQKTPEYRELYQFLLKCFTQADIDFDGRITPEDFDSMVDAAASLPRRFG